MLRLLVIAWCVAVFALHATPVRADSVALLPLDSEKRLEIYGQPIASELARAMKAAGLDVVVVGAKMAVPTNVQLIVDGTIKAKGDVVTLTIRIRDPRDGTTLETLPPSSSSLTDIDKAASEVSAKLVPAAKSELAALAKRNAPPPDTTQKPPPDTTQKPPPPPRGPELPVVAIGVSSNQNGAPVMALEAAFAAELDPWARAHGHIARTIDAAKLEHDNGAPGAVSAAGAEVGVAFHVLGFVVEPGKVPLARARVRVRIMDGTHVAFDRVVITDTIVGDRAISEQDFTARAVREVLAIAHPHIRKAVAGWK